MYAGSVAGLIEIGCHRDSVSPHFVPEPAATIASRHRPVSRASMPHPEIAELLVCGQVLANRNQQCLVQLTIFALQQMRKQIKANDVAAIGVLKKFLDFVFNHQWTDRNGNAPARQIPLAAMMNSGTLGNSRPTRSPGLTPRRWSIAAQRNRGRDSIADSSRSDRRNEWRHGPVTAQLHAATRRRPVHPDSDQGPSAVKQWGYANAPTVHPYQRYWSTSRALPRCVRAAPAAPALSSPAASNS